MYCESTYPVIWRCVFSGNVAAGVGGGLASQYGYVPIVDCTFSRNVGGAGGGGILGGGLRVERAMETGEGVTDIMQSISETMKKFGGPRILTREEAIESPAAERNFIIQRQILGQLMGIKDAGKQTQMMEALQAIDKHGVEASSGAKEKFGELMAAGEKVADETTDTLTKAQLQYQRTRITQGTEWSE